jgi:hypothetical protein
MTSSSDSSLAPPHASIEEDQEPLPCLSDDLFNLLYQDFQVSRSTYTRQGDWYPGEAYSFEAVEGEVYLRLVPDTVARARQTDYQLESIMELQDRNLCSVNDFKEDRIVWALDCQSQHVYMKSDSFTESDMRHIRQLAHACTQFAFHMSSTQLLTIRRRVSELHTRWALRKMGGICYLTTVTRAHPTPAYPCHIMATFRTSEDLSRDLLGELRALPVTPLTHLSPL